MSKLKESEIIDYLYGNLNSGDRKRVEEAINSDSQLKQEVEDISQMLNIVGKLEDKEVIPPTFIFPDEKKNVHKWWQSRPLRTIAAIAAGISLIIVTSYFTGLGIVLGEGQLTLAFGERAPQVDKGQIQSWMKEVMTEYNEQTEEKMYDMETQLVARINQSEKQRMDSMQGLISDYSSHSNALMREYVKQVNKENLEMIQNFFLVSSEKQQEYLDAVLADFNKFYQDQRAYDLQMIETGLYQMHNNTKAKQKETDQVLANLIDIVKTQNK